MFGTSLTGEGVMRRALELAERGRGWVEPNPMVGAVLATRREDGSYACVAEGWHAKHGGPHAEVAALEAARVSGVDVSGLTMAVTLEPCGHEGKTPPCVKALIDAGVSEVLIGTLDPSPAMNGRSAAALRDAGVAVTVGVCEADAAALIAPFAKRLATGMPWVIAKWAQTIDGKTATSTGDSQWISNAASRRLVHRWRGEVDAIMIGTGTVLADDPQLTARDVQPKRVARRVVFDIAGHVSPAAKVYDVTQAPSTAIVAKGEEPGRPEGVDLLPLPVDIEGRVPLDDAMREMVRRYDITNLMVEGGATLLGELWRHMLLDELRVFAAPKLLGDAEGRGAIDGPRKRTIDEATTWSLYRVGRIEDDVLLVYRKPA